MGWFTITVMNMSAGKEIEIIFNGLKEKVPENTAILSLINRQNERDKDLVVVLNTTQVCLSTKIPDEHAGIE